MATARRPPRSICNIFVRLVGPQLPWLEGEQIGVFGIDEDLYPTASGPAKGFNTCKVGDKTFGFRIEQWPVYAKIVVIAVHQYGRLFECRQFL